MQLQFSSKSQSQYSSPIRASFMENSNHQLHILFFPLMAQGHILPTLDMAKLLSSRGVKTTIITTTPSAPLFTKTTQKTQHINLKIIEFPTKQADLPEGLENFDLAKDEEQVIKLFRSLSLFQQPLDDILRELNPNAVVADMFFPWATDVASKYKIPRLVFQGTSFFTMCAMDSISKYNPQNNVSSGSELFVLPGLPDEIKMVRTQIHVKLGFENDVTRLLDRAAEAEKKSFGFLVNSFYELESAYVDHYRKVLGRKAWHIGPVSLCNRSVEEKAHRGKKSSIDDRECLKWLESKKPNSVVYVSFGTNYKFSASQLHEIAKGLEASGQNFIWVVTEDHKNDEQDNNNEEDWLPKGYNEKIVNEGKGLIIRGWAPQILILEHGSIGGFVTHCGWNSVLEAVSAGVSMVTWPIFSDQFYNERLIHDVLKIGVGVGAKKWVRLVGDYVKSEAIEKAVKEIMVGERGDQMRGRARELGLVAKRAVEEGGSSYNDLGNLMEELRAYWGLK